MEDIIIELRTMYEEKRDDAEIRERLKDKVFSAVSELGGAEEQQGIADFFGGLNKTIERAPVQCLLGVALQVDIFISSGTRAEQRLAELQKLSEDNPEDVLLRKMYDLGQYAAFASSEGDEAKGRLEKLRRMYNEKPKDASVRELYAKALYDSFFDCEGVEAEEFLKELFRLHKEKRKDSSVLSFLSLGLFGAASRRAKAGDAEGAVAFLKQTTGLGYYALTRKRLDQEQDFAAIHGNKEFVRFRDGLPKG